MTISTQQAIESLERFQNPEPWEPKITDRAYEALQMAISALEKQEQDRWHSVAKEGNPKKGGHYLVTLFDEIDSWTEPLYWNTTFGGRWQGLIEDDFSDIGNVSAWRPLPEPYKAEEFEEDRDER